MKRFLQLIRYILPYKQYMLLTMLSNLGSIMFSLVSFTMVIPFLGILFEKQPLVEQVPVFSFDTSVLEQYFYYYVSQFILLQGKSGALAFICILVVVSSVFKNLFRYLALFFLTPLRNGVVRDIRRAMYDKVLELQLRYFSNARKGDLISRMTTDVKEVEWSLVNSFTLIFRDPITIAVYLTVLIYMSPSLTLFVFLMLPASGLLIGIVGKNLKKASSKAQSQMGILLSYFEETLTGVRVIKSFNAQTKMRKRFGELNDVYTKLMNRMLRRFDSASPVSEVLGTILMITVMWYGGSQVLSNESTMTSQAFIGYIVIFSQIINPAKDLSSAYYALQRGLASLDRINAVLHAEVEITEKDNAIDKKDFTTSIEYRNVSFKYGDHYVIKNVDLTIAKGKTIALVGQSGSGKTTLVNLLPRFYDVSEGEILIDGVAIKDLKINSLRQLMGIVSQDSILFNDTIVNNIAFGSNLADTKQIETAAKIANAHDFIVQQEQGYNTNIGDGGVKLSGGQKQRISIARAVLKDSPILILDEATSALDNESEKLVQAALNQLMVNRTVIVIAHRLSTIMHADEICVMQKGEIVERGTHQALIEKEDGVYRKLYQMSNGGVIG